MIIFQLFSRIFFQAVRRMKQTPNIHWLKSEVQKFQLQAVTLLLILLFLSQSTQNLVII